MNNSFLQLRLKLLVKILIIAAMTYIGLLLFSAYVIDGVLQDAAATLLDSMGIYRWAQSNKDDLIVAMIALGELVCVYCFALSAFAGYLNQITAAVDMVVNDGDELIELASELHPIQTRLNTIKLSLQRRKMEAQESERRKNDLIVYLAHDLKTPLTSVIGYLTLMEEAPDLPEEQKKKYMAIASQKAQKLEELINELFEVARFSVQDLSLTRRNINLPLLLQQLTEEFYPLLQRRGMHCCVDCDKTLLLQGDADKLARVFDNLFRNAIFYSEQGSEITIEAKAAEGSVLITFKNYGTTIPQEKLNRIFEQFYRGDELRSGENAGAGLGLAIAKKIVEQHGGTITADSSALWTTFSVMLPIENQL